MGYTGTSLGRAIERGRAEDALRRNENAFRSLIDNSSDVIVILDPDGSYRYCSPSIQRILGYEPRKLIARNAFDFIHPEDVTAVRQVFLENVKELGRSDRAEFRFRHRDGSWRVFDAMGRNLLGDPRIGGIIVNSRDITERRHAMEHSGTASGAMSCYSMKWWRPSPCMSWSMTSREARRLPLSRRQP